MVNDRGAVVIADVRNGGAMPGLSLDVCVEVPARFTKDRVETLPVAPIPLSVRGLVQTVKAYEELTIEAAITGDRSTAIAALVANPLISSYQKAEAFFERALGEEQTFLAQFL